MTIDHIDVEPDSRAFWSLAASVNSDEISGAVAVTFTQRPKQLEARQRLPYRTALLVLTLSRFNRNSASLVHIHTLMWATRTRRTREMFVAWWAGRRLANASTSRIDPDLQITLNLAIIHGLVEPVADRKRIRLTEKGIQLAQVVESADGLLSPEKSFLDSLGALNDARMNRQLGEVA